MAIIQKDGVSRNEFAAEAQLSVILSEDRAIKRSEIFRIFAVAHWEKYKQGWTRLAKVND